MANFLDILKTVGSTAYGLQTGDVQVSVKTNLGPEFKVWDGTRKIGGTPGLAQLLGIRGAVIVRDSAGKPIFIHGDPPATNWIYTALLVGGVSYLGYLAWRGFKRKR